MGLNYLRGNKELCPQTQQRMLCFCDKGKTVAFSMDASLTSITCPEDACANAQTQSCLLDAENCRPLTATFTDSRLLSTFNSSKTRP